MAIVFQKEVPGVHYEVRTAGLSVRLYTNTTFHSRYNPNHLFTGAIWDLLTLPSLSTDNLISQVLVLGVGDGTVIHQVHALVPVDQVIRVEMDPGEMINQANNPDYLPRVLEYAQKMLSWRMNHDEQTLTHMVLTDRGVMTRIEPRY